LKIAPSRQDSEDIATVAPAHPRLQRIAFDADERSSGSTIHRHVDVQRHPRFSPPPLSQRERLKNRVRYVLTHDARFRTMPSAAGLVCSLVSWPEVSEVGRVPVSWRHDDPSAPANAIESLLKAAFKPLLVSDVLSALAENWNISESRALPIEEIADGGHSHAAQLEVRQRLDALWRETRALPASQRTALLLSLRDIDGGSAIALFSLMGIASVNEVAAAIDLPVRQLARLWRGCRSTT
jgi:hypothetical protein